jgi:ATP-dependent DNA helicase RecG
MIPKDCKRLAEVDFPIAEMSRHAFVEVGLAESRGERKGRTWHLSAATYRRLGERAGYVRQHGFEPLQQEQMVLQYVGKHGRITRREVAELCRLSPLQARSLLSRLAASGRLMLRGSRRGAHHGLSSMDMDKSKSGMDKSIKKSKRPNSRRRP